MRNGKVIIGLLIGIIISVAIVFAIVETNFATTRTYTRKEMPDIVVSTAMSLNQNNLYSNYEQKTMDKLDVSGNYYNIRTVYWEI